MNSAQIVAVAILILLAVIGAGVLLMGLAVGKPIAAVTGAVFVAYGVVEAFRIVD